MVPDQSIHELVNVLGVTLKDAKTLVTVDNGARLDYYDEVLTQLARTDREVGHSVSTDQYTDRQWPRQTRTYARTVANWFALVFRSATEC